MSLLIRVSSILVLSLVASWLLLGNQQKKPSKKTASSADWVEQQLASMTLREKIGQFFMVASWSNKGEKHQASIEKMVAEDRVGGIIYFQGDRHDLQQSIQRMQAKAKIPLLIGMDAEWGVAMRLEDEKRFPYMYSVGQANDEALAEQMGAMMAAEARSLGIHMNFSPVADVNSNPNNPVIGFRSLGEDPKRVGELTASMVRGIEQNGVFACVKHFPGHGDTDKDSHYDLPTISKSATAFDKTEFVPFRAGIQAGVSSVMVGHLHVPELDPTGTPSSLSKVVIQDYLRTKLGFRGLVISDALNMKAVADRYGKTEVVVKAFEAGCDILLYPEDISGSISAIEQKVKQGKISRTEIDQRCQKILEAKYAVHFGKRPVKSFSQGEVDWVKKAIYERAVTLIKNEKQTLPLLGSEKIAHVAIGTNTYHFSERSSDFGSVDHYHFFTVEEAMERMQETLKSYKRVVTTFHASTVRVIKGYGIPSNYQTWLDWVPKEAAHTVVLFGNPAAFRTIQSDQVDALVLAFENSPLVQERTAQMVFGAIPFRGKLRFDVSPVLAKGTGILLEATDRLKFSQPEEVGISSEKMSEIDAIVQKGIQAKAFPGCQVLVAVHGKIIYQKAFGKLTFDGTDSTTVDHVYDLASISKIVGSTAGLMYLQSQGAFSLEKQLDDYIPEVTKDSNFGEILLKDMMAHQAGLTAWIPFYKKTLEDGKPSSKWYSTTKKPGFETQVASDLWIKDSYADTIYKRILASGLTPGKKYEYSDLGYYFVKKIIEKKSGLRMDQFMQQQYFGPLGLQTMGFNPLRYLSKKRLVPTEDDQAFRKQLIHGYVHDPGAAMLGGVGGHAGIFANAHDLAVMMQLFLNKGSYAGKRYISPTVVELYTKQQFPGNRRGAGFDRPTPKAKGGPTCELVSQESYGHSGFTGTLTWADPAYGINFVFLSNRVCPSAENWKIRDMNIRTEIQRVIYEAVLAAKNKK